MLFTKRRYTITMHDGLRVPSEILVTFSPRNSYERERERIKKHFDFSFTPDEAAPCCYYPATSFSPSPVNIFTILSANTY